ncbi:CHAT domain-containing protein [Chloroflexales bacterium ZM16-3]|nr:CHAT domain-containing protein [Chloroflexales bacterium ZM16-3]
MSNLTGDQALPVELTITFRPSSDRINLHWESDVLGVTYSAFTPPYQGDDLELVIRGLDHLQHPTGGLSAGDLERLAGLGLPVEHGFLGERAHKAVGRALFRALTAYSEGARVLRQARDSAIDKDVPLALRLHFPPEGVALAALPWELLWDDEELPFLLRGRYPVDCTRCIELNEAIPPTRLSPTPLRILPIVPHAGVDTASRAAERTARLAAWQPLIDQGLAVMLKEVSPATPRTIGDAFRNGPPPDIVHYVGHGAYHDGSGRLLLDDDNGGRSATPISQLRPLLVGARMVVLTACQSGIAGSVGGGVAPFNGVAPALSAGGVPIVVGMQLTVRISAANRATSLIYQALAQGQSVQSALGEARRALYAEEEDNASWYVPTLYIRSRETGPVYLTKCTAPPPASSALSLREAARIAEEERREAERQEIERNRREGGIFYVPDPFPDSDPIFPQLSETLLGDNPPELIVITGEPGSGRTTALHFFYGRRPRGPGLPIENTAPIYLSGAGKDDEPALLLAIIDALRTLLIQLCYHDNALAHELGRENFDHLLALTETGSVPQHNLNFLVRLLDQLRCAMLVICIDNVAPAIQREELFLLLHQVVAPHLRLYLRIAYTSPPADLSLIEGWMRPTRQRTSNGTRSIHLLDLHWKPNDLRNLFHHHVPPESGITEYRDQILGMINSPNDLETWIAVFNDEQYRDRIDEDLWEKLYHAMRKVREQRRDRHQYRWTLNDWKQARMILAQERPPHEPG